MLAAAVELVAEDGFGSLTVAQIIGRARVSRKTFYELFRDREDCVLAALEATLADAELLAREAFARETSWRAGVRAALAQLLVLIDEEPAHARVCLVESLSGGARIRARRERMLAELARVADLGRESPRRPSELSRLTAEGVVGGVLAVLHRYQVERPGEPVADLLNQLMSTIVQPYLGNDAAREELERGSSGSPETPLPRASLRSPEVLSPPGASNANVRLTHRTLRVLAAIAAHPGASNREVAEGAGIADPGQISKLLGRLAGLGLVENHGVGKGRGAQNAWSLTERGSQVERATKRLSV